MKYKFKFEDIVKYEVEVEAEDEFEARNIVQNMDTEDLHDFEIDRSDHTETELVGVEE